MDTSFRMSGNNSQQSDDNLSSISSDNNRSFFNEQFVDNVKPMFPKSESQPQLLLLGSAAIHPEKSPFSWEMDAFGDNFNQQTSYLSQLPPAPGLNSNNYTPALHLYDSSDVYDNAWDARASYSHGSSFQETQQPPVECGYSQDVKPQFSQPYGQTWNHNPGGALWSPDRRSYTGNDLPKDRITVQNSHMADRPTDKRQNSTDQKYLNDPGVGMECKPQSWINNNGIVNFKGNFTTRVNPNLNFVAQHGHKSVQQKKQFFQVIQTPGQKALPNRPLATSSTRFFKISHPGVHIYKQQLQVTSPSSAPQTVNRPLKLWKEACGAAGRVTTIMTPGARTKNIYHPPLTPTRPWQTSPHQHKVLGRNTFAPTSALIVDKDGVEPPTPVRSAFSASSPSLKASSSAMEDAPPSLTPPTVVKNAIFGHKKLKHRCGACATREATFNSLLTHVKIHRQPFCILCAAIVATPKHLNAHMKKSHSRVEARDSVSVTSKYGRKRRVLSSVAHAQQTRIYPRRKTKARGGSKKGDETETDAE